MVGVRRFAGLDAFPAERFVVGAITVERTLPYGGPDTRPSTEDRTREAASAVLRWEPL